MKILTVALKQQLQIVVFFLNKYYLKSFYCATF